MAQASRVGIDNAGGGLILGAGNLLVNIDGAAWTVVGDSVADHGTGSHNSPNMTVGSGLVSIDGIAACVAGNAASCGHTTTGAGLVGASL